MQDNNNTDVQTYQYHHIVAVDVRVNVKTGEVVEVGDPYLEDTLPPSEEEMIWSWEADVWIEQSPADRFGPSCSPGVWAKTGWGRSSSMLESIFAKAKEHPCVVCDREITEHMHGVGADPCCAPCYHEPLIHDGGGACDECDFVWPSAIVCDDCEKPIDGEKHRDSDGETICSDCLTQ